LVRLLSFRKATGRRPLRILIVEDSENYALLLLRELRRGGYEPEHQRVRTPEAMKQVLSRSDWDVINSDYRMPHFGAPEALTVSQVFENHVGEDADLWGRRSATSGRHPAQIDNPVLKAPSASGCRHGK
jgi:hypothetical protein